MVSGECDSSATESMNGGDCEEDTEGASEDVATEIGERTVELLNIGGEVADDGEAADDAETADDGTLAAGGEEAGVKLIV